jgi:hypothetical protein
MILTLILMDGRLSRLSSAPQEHWKVAKQLVGLASSSHLRQDHQIDLTSATL